MSPHEATLASLQHQLEPLVAREISGIAAIESMIPHASPDYVVMLQSTKTNKQANVEQMATLVRMQGGTPDETGGFRKTLTHAHAAISSRVSITATLRVMRAAEIELVALYSDALSGADGVLKRALTKALGRALVHVHLLTAHLAKRTQSKADAALLPASLGEYFAGGEARACMRCHLDRPGRAGALERRDPHPYTYVCAACHDEVLGEFPSDLAVQFDSWPPAVREAKVMQHALGRVSKLNANGRVLHPLAGLEPDLPTPAAEHALIVPVLAPAAGPAIDERPGALEIQAGDGAEGDYVRTLFTARQMWRHW
jgi:hypothetical protein